MAKTATATQELVKIAPLDPDIVALITDPKTTVELISDPEAVALRMALEILEQTTVAGVLAGSDTVSARDLLDVPIILADFALQRSDLKDGLRAYAVIKATNEATGEPLTITTGSRSIMAQLYQLQRLSAFPLPVAIVEIGQAKNGNSAPLGLRPVATGTQGEAAF